jgi:hypothetical protein
MKLKCFLIEVISKCLGSSPDRSGILSLFSLKSER